MNAKKLLRVELFYGVIVALGSVAFAGVSSADAPALWEKSEWIAAADAKVADEEVQKASRAADGTSWFVREIVNEGEVKSARWTTTGLGVYEIYVNGKRVGDDALKPGFTHAKKTRRAFSYDVTSLVKTGAGEKNFLAAEVSAGWWRDKITKYAGRKSAFRAVLEVTYADGSVKVYGTNAADWKAGVGGPVTHAGIFDGEEYDARVEPPFFGSSAFAAAEKSDEFNGEILPSEGGEVCRRFDLELKPVAAYVWKGVDGADDAQGVFGRIHKLRDVSFDGKTAVTLAKGETLVVDFGQNCAAVPAFTFDAKEGTVLTCLPGEMLNDRNGETSRGNDGPGGSVYRVNLRIADNGMRLRYTFGKRDGFVSYLPRHTFFGYRYISMTATDDVSLMAVSSVPVTSIKKEMESGSIETGVADLNKLVSNAYWGQLSNYLSVPTDCPQRNERLGWTADTQVFIEAGAFNADTHAFFHKWTRDLRDSQDPRGGYIGAAPEGPYGDIPMRIGWADAGVIVPYRVWRHFGDRDIISENWDAMEKFVAHVNETKYDYNAIRPEAGRKQYADWLSLERLEVHGPTARDGKKKFYPETIRYWNYLGACYWCWDARMMEAMAVAIGKDSAKYAKMAAEAKDYIMKNFFAADGLLLAPMRDMQTPTLFALKLGLVNGDAKEATVKALRRNFAEHGDCLQTGFLGTSILMDTLSENGMTDLAYTVLLQHRYPSWLYSVDQGATTIWERWNSYTKDKGFGPVGMNSFNHYAYGAVVAWMYKEMAGIASDPNAPGFKNIIMSPKPDRRVGFVRAEYKSASGLVKSAWRYEGDRWIWEFTVPEGSTATVTLPGETEVKQYGPGSHVVTRSVAATPCPQQTGTLRLMSYNVHHCEGMDGKVDCARTAAAISREKPDFVGLQEVDVKVPRSMQLDEPAELARHTGMHATFAKAIDYNGGEYGVAVLSKEEPLSTIRRQLPGPERRVMLLCEFNDCWFGTMHLDGRTVDGDPAPAHVMSVPTISNEVVKCASGGKPVFLTGDWNATPKEKAVAMMEKFVTILNDTSKPTNGNLQRCIDYIVVDKAHEDAFRIRDVRVVMDTMTSDHKPVVVGLDRLK